MAKFYGVIGYVDTVETTPGVWVEQTIERNYYGDVTRNARKLQSGSQVNDNIDINNELSIVADPYAMQNFHTMRYVIFMGNAWKVTNVEVKYPRLILTLGGLYTNGQ